MEDFLYDIENCENDSFFLNNENGDIILQIFKEILNQVK